MLFDSVHATLESRTFGELFQVWHQKFIHDLTQEYHEMLLDLWTKTSPAEIFFVTLAEARFPDAAKPYQARLRFLRGPRFRGRLRYAAAQTRVPHVPGMETRLVSVPSRGHLSPTHARALAEIISRFCQQWVPAWALAESAGTYHHEYSVMVETHQLGAEILRLKPGWTWAELTRQCSTFEIDPETIFWWVPMSARNRNDAFINPCVWPIQIPSAEEMVQNLIFFSALTCKQCGRPSSSGECPDCRYRNGGTLLESDEPADQDSYAHMQRPISQRLREAQEILSTSEQ